VGVCMYESIKESVTIPTKMVDMNNIKLDIGLCSAELGESMGKGEL